MNIKTKVQAKYRIGSMYARRLYVSLGFLIIKLKCINVTGSINVIILLRAFVTVKGVTPEK